MEQRLKNKFDWFKEDMAAAQDGRPVFTLPSAHLREAALFLRDEAGFDFLADIVGTDSGETLGATYYFGRSGALTDMIVLKTEAEGRDDARLPSLCDVWDVAEIYEREVYDFFGITFVGHPDMRRIFLRGDWNGYPLRKDYDADPAVNPVPQTDESFELMDGIPMPCENGGEPTRRTMYDNDEYVINFGPQHPATHGVLHLRVSLDGEIVRSVDPHFGYIHRGIEKMCESYMYTQILHLTDRLDYLSGTMNRHAFCLCCEKALQLEVPERAVVIRTMFDELTRIASHLIGWGSMCMDMGAITAFMYGLRDREKIMDIFEETAGGRLMVNYNVIGGVAKELHPDFQKKVKEFIPYMRKMLREHHLLFTGNPIATGRMKGVGDLPLEKAISLGITGPSGRASGWANDLRKHAPYAAYGKVDFEEVVRPGGGTFDRYIIRLDEIEQSLRILEQLVDNIPEGPYAAPVKGVVKLPAGEWLQLVENARGQFGVHITSKGDKFPWRVKFRSPSLVLANALKEIAPGGKVADLIMLGGSLDYVIPCIDR